MGRSMRLFTEVLNVTLTYTRIRGGIGKVDTAFKYPLTMGLAWLMLIGIKVVTTITFKGQLKLNKSRGLKTIVAK